MIVKNEEKNIRKALEWAKPIAFEQIVVDTGSTDNTVKIAEEMGAKVFHFTWINDFAAAKNFAIEQASGDWIAFLDADEYFQVEDAHKIPKILEYLMNNKLPVGKEKKYVNVVETLWVQLNKKKEITSTPTQIRIFRNAPWIRYSGRIHEQIISTEKTHPLVNINLSSELSIYHTGYAWTDESRKMKTERNIPMLEKELEHHPNSASLQLYYSESLFVAGRDNEALKFAILACDNQYPDFDAERKASAYQTVLYTMLTIYNSSGEKKELFFEYYNKAVNFNPNVPDYDIAAGFWSYESCNYSDAIYYFESALDKANKYKDYRHGKILAYLNDIYSQLAVSCQKINNDKCWEYSIKALETDPYQENILLPLLTYIAHHSELTLNDAKLLLNGLYNFNNKKDILFTLKVAMLASYSELESYISSFLTKEDYDKLFPKKKIVENIEKKTSIDIDFNKIVELIINTSEKTLISNIKDNILNLEKDDPTYATSVINNYNYWKFWGQLNIEEAAPELISRRVKILKEQTENLINLYNSLCDYRSKKTLLGIIENWFSFSSTPLDKIRDTMNYQYFDPDLFVCNANMNIVDLGAYQGDTFLSYISVFGENYNKYYCYEALSENVEKLKINTAHNRDIIIREKAVTNKAGTCFFEKNERFDSANELSETGKIKVETVTLDDDISERIDLLKMDIEGSEYDALCGAKNHIKNDKPILAISIYHSNDDLFRIPQLIRELYDGYKFYLRYNGGNIYPSEYVLIAVP